MDNPICLITGATEGVGKATAVRLAAGGFTVVLAARDAAKGKLTQEQIAASTRNHNVDFIAADLESLQQVRQLADTFRQRYPRLDVLINNAGVFLPARKLTEDGLETTFQVNYLAHFLLTELLLDELKKSAQGRVINLSSSVYTAGKLNLDNLQSEVKFSALGTYATSKLLMLLFTIELANRLNGTKVTANAVHPGIARTRMMLRAPGIFKLVSYLALPFSISAEKAAATSVHLASSEHLSRVSGGYFTASRQKRVKTGFNTQQNREALWNISMELLQRRGND